LGNTLTLVFSEIVSIGAGGNAGWAITPSGGAATLAYSSGDDTNTLIYAISRTIYDPETATIAYTQPTNGIEDAAGNDLANLGPVAVTNNSTQIEEAQGTFTGVGGGGDGSVGGGGTGTILGGS
jgi:hypothetical protein